MLLILLTLIFWRIVDTDFNYDTESPSWPSSGRHSINRESWTLIQREFFNEKESRQSVWGDKTFTPHCVSVQVNKESDLEEAIKFPAPPNYSRMADIDENKLLENLAMGSSMEEHNDIPNKPVNRTKESVCIVNNNSLVFHMQPRQKKIQIPVFKKLANDWSSQEVQAR